MRKINHRPSFHIYPIVVVLTLMFLQTRLLISRNVECYTQYGTCPSEVSALLSGLQNKPLLWFLPSRQVNRQLESVPQIAAITLHRRLPSTLVVVLDMRKPLGTVSNSVLGAAVVADVSGYLFTTASNSSLPLLVVSPPLSSSDRLSTNQLKALNILSTFTSLSSQKITGRLENVTLFVDLGTGIEVVLDINRPLSEWYSSLQLILSRSRIMAKIPRKIDLRFTDSVITY